jgi:hypothetical protein
LKIENRKPTEEKQANEKQSTRKQSNSTDNPKFQRCNNKCMHTKLCLLPDQYKGHSGSSRISEKVYKRSEDGVRDARGPGRGVAIALRFCWFPRPPRRPLRRSRISSPPYPFPHNAAPSALSERWL